MSGYSDLKSRIIPLSWLLQLSPFAASTPGPPPTKSEPSRPRSEPPDPSDAPPRPPPAPLDEPPLPAPSPPVPPPFRSKRDVPGLSAQDDKSGVVSRPAMSQRVM